MMHTIWKNLNVSLDTLNDMAVGTMTGIIGIEFTEIAKDHLRATMPVDQRTKQPYGLLHGGASAALIETLGSVASGLVIDNELQSCVGISLNVSHLRGLSKGYVHGIARPLHLGRSTHVWEIKIHDDEDRLSAVGRLTVAVLDKHQPIIVKDKDKSSKEK